MASASGGGGERTTFIGAIVPPVIKALPKLIENAGKEKFKQVLEGTNSQKKNLLFLFSQYPNIFQQ